MSHIFICSYFNNKNHALPLIFCVYRRTGLHYVDNLHKRIILVQTRRNLQYTNEYQWWNSSRGLNGVF